MKVFFKRSNKFAKIPKKAHESDACYDVVATSIEELDTGVIKYGLGFALGLPDGYQLDLRPRSSIYKAGLSLCNAIGTGDSAYTGEYCAFFYNIIPSLPNYKVGDRILQIQIPGVFEIEFVEVDELPNTDRGDGGFGSTGL